MTYRVVFIDDHDIVRSGFAQLLSLEEDIQVVGSSTRQNRLALDCRVYRPISVFVISPCPMRVA